MIYEGTVSASVEVMVSVSVEVMVSAMVSELRLSS
jgi:hypothetical protein